MGASLKEMGAEAPITLFILLFVTVLTKPLLALVRCHFMTLALFSAWHKCSSDYVLKNFSIILLFTLLFPVVESPTLLVLRSLISDRRLCRS